MLQPIQSPATTKRSQVPSAFADKAPSSTPVVLHVPKTKTIPNQSFFDIDIRANPPTRSLAFKDPSEQQKYDSAVKSKDSQTLLVFGFDKASFPAVLQKFQSLGGLRHTPYNPDNNWILISYYNPAFTQAALTLNKTLVDSVYVGVRRTTRRIEDEVMTESSSMTSQPSHQEIVDIYNQNPSWALTWRLFSS
eukprot:TRINITY_DN3323_c0_g1_i1.p1 TRINITY_DN3323_c0_g1~~TRINITY_DN3323_c0_g1_i1.p1  ORF type:complete len:192 (+),score=43.25 TRINITY_DN3323_c0_g1_i1:46-621(+)